MALTLKWFVGSVVLLSVLSLTTACGSTELPAINEALPGNSSPLQEAVGFQAPADAIFSVTYEGVGQ